MTIPSLLDLACETVASAPGTSSTISLSGTAVSGGLFTWSNAGAVNGVVYRLYILDGNNRELAFATYSSSGNQFTNRTTLVASVGGTKQTTPITAGAGSIVCAYAGAEDIVTPASMLGGDINKFINGPLDVWQRGTTGTSTTTAGPTTQIGPDGWYIAPTGASVTWAQCAGRQLTQYGLQVQGAASVTDITIKQRIEAAMAAPLSGQIVTAQGWLMPTTTSNVVSIGGTTNTSGATIALTGVTVPAGAYIVVAVQEYAATSGTLADTASNSYAPKDTSMFGTVSLNIFTCGNSAALSSGTITYTKGTSGVACCITAFYVTGVTSSATIDVGMGGWSNSSFFTGTTTPSVTSGGPPSSVNEVLVGIIAINGSAAVTLPSGWSAASPAQTVSSKLSVAMGVQISQQTTTDITFNPTISIADGGLAFVIGIQGVASSTTTINPTLTVKHANAPNNWSASTTDVSAVSLQSCPPNQWTRFAYTFTASALASNGLEASFDFGNNFGNGYNAIQITELDIRATPQATLGLNSNPPPPELRPISAELQKCQRWLWTSYPNGTTPGNAQSPYLQLVGTTSSSTSVTSQWVPYTVEMFESPALTFFSPNEGTPSNGHWTFAGTITGAGQASTATAATSQSSAMGFAATLTVTGATAGDAVFVFGGALATCEL